MKTNKAGYDPFAWVYNRHWGGEFSQKVLPVIDRLLLQQVPPGGRILDLACGTGQLARLLWERGYSVVGIDHSEEMLAFARLNAPDCEFHLADARSFQLRVPVHLAVSTYDSLNHILDPGELGQVFQCVWNSLEKGGMFAFDLNMEAGYLSRWNGSFHILEADHAVIVRSRYEPGEQLGHADITIFRRMAGSWNRTDLSLEQYCFKETEVRTLLDTTGFGEIQAMDAEGDLDLAGEGGRAFFLARKPDR